MVKVTVPDCYCTVKAVKLELASSDRHVKRTDVANRAITASPALQGGQHISMMGCPHLCHSAQCQP